MKIFVFNDSLRSDLFCAGLLAVVVVLLYGHTLHAPWYLDDFGAILHNPLVRDFKGATGKLLTARGVAIWSFALNYRLGGIQPFGFHLVNLSLHLLNGLLVFLLLKRLVRAAPLWPLLGALLYVCHPLQTQAVTYIVQRMTVLSAAFFLAALYGFLRARDVWMTDHSRVSARALGLYLLALLCGALAVFTKENTAVLPLVLFLWLCFFPETGERRRFLYLSLLPFCLAPMWLAVSLLIPVASDSVSLITLTGARLPGLADQPSLYYLFTEFSVLWVYLRLFLIPFGQAFDHAYPVVTQLLTIKSLAAFAGLAGLLALAVKLSRRQPLIALGIVWFFATLAIESSLIPLDPLFEHRLYLPLFGLVLVIIGGARLLPRSVGVWLCALAVLICFPLTWARNQLWNDPLALYTDNLRRTPDNVPVLTELGSRYLDQQDYVQAESLLRKALRLDPEFSSATIALAKLLLEQNRNNESLELLFRAMPTTPASDTKYLLFNLAANYFNLGDLQLADDYLQQVLVLDPSFGEAHGLLGRSRIRQGRWQEAEAFLAKALLSVDDQPLLHFEYAVTLHGLGRRDECRVALERTLQIDPRFSDALLHLGLLALEAGSHPAVQGYLDQLQSLDPQAAARLQAELSRASGQR